MVDLQYTDLVQGATIVSQMTSKAYILKYLYDGDAIIQEKFGKKQKWSMPADTVLKRFRLPNETDGGEQS